MAKVFKGGFVIPGNMMDEFFKAMSKAEKARDPFRKYLQGLNTEFEAQLNKKFAQRTARKHTTIVDMFIEFLCRQTDVEKIDDIDKSIANRHFQQWYRRKVLDSTSPDEIRVALKKFFTFLVEEKGIENKAVLESLK
jgi:site-specific recombinase XerD